MTAISDRSLLSTLEERRDVEDDTEERVPGSDYHLAAILNAYDVIHRYAEDTNQPWYVTAEVTVLVDLPARVRNPWQAMPDVYVVLNSTPGPRTSLATRAGDSFPHFICEVASPSTYKRDLETKQRLYADLGVQEYIVFDPTGQYLHQALRAWRRQPDGIWAPWAPDEAGFLHSTVLGLRLRVESMLLRVYHPQLGCLPTARELADQIQTLTDQQHTPADQNQALADQNQALADQNLVLAEQHLTVADQNHALADQLAQETAQRQTLEERNRALEEALARLQQSQ